jgi:HSP20 family protein
MKLIRFQTPTSYAPTFSHSALLDQIDRLFEAGLAASARNDSPGFRAFPVDLYQDKDSVIVRAELPGFRKEDIQVQVADDVLTLSASSAKEEDKKTTSIERAISLPENLDYAKVSASYENGVLTVTLPKREEVKPRTIAVEIK